MRHHDSKRVHLLRQVAVALLVLGLSSLAWSAKPLQVGDMAPDALGKDTAGVPVTVSEYRGKVVVVSFWASWCTPCRKELDTLERVQRVGGPKGVQVVAVNWKEDRRIIREFKKAAPELQMRLASDPDGRLGNRYGVDSIPHMLVVDKEGKVFFINVGYGDSTVGEVVEVVNRALALTPPSIPAASTAPQ